MSELETEAIPCELVIKPALHIMEARLPVALVKMVNDTSIPRAMSPPITPRHWWGKSGKIQGPQN